MTTLHAPVTSANRPSKPPPHYMKSVNSELTDFFKALCRQALTTCLDQMFLKKRDDVKAYFAD